MWVNTQQINSYTYEVVVGNKIKIQAPKLQIIKTVQDTTHHSTLILFNKPVGYVVSKSDAYNKTIYSLLPPEFRTYYYIGRLDKNSHGLMLLTDNPTLVHIYEHPKYRIEKEYRVVLDRALSPKDRITLFQGIKDQDELLKCVKIRQITPLRYQVVLNEGKKRHIRRMFHAV